MNIRIPQSSLFFLPIGLLVIFLGLVGLSFQTGSPQDRQRTQDIDEGLQEIKVSFQIYNDGTPELLSIDNLSSAIILAASDRAEEKDELLPVALQEVLSNLTIREVTLPPLSDETLKIVDKSESQDIEFYLQNVYTVFSENKVDFDFGVGFDEAQKGNLDIVNEQIKINQNLYLALISMDVPQPAASLHKKYIRLSQVQHHFLQSILASIEDPLRIRIDIQLVQTILLEIDQPLRDDLRKLSQDYDIELQRQI